MSDDPETQRIIGQLQATTETLDSRVGRIEQKVDKLIELAASAKGGWRMLIAVGATAGSLGAGVASVINWIRHP